MLRATKQIGRRAEMTRSIWVVVLAAGLSSRMGEPKLMLPLAGQTLIRHTALAALACSEHVAVVCRPEDAPLQQELADLPVRLVSNAEASLGLSTSLRAGIAEVQRESGEAAVILLGDMPGVGTEVLQWVMTKFGETGSRIVRAKYADQPGHPVLFHHSLFPDLLALQGDQGAKPLIAKYAHEIAHVEIADKHPADVDTPEDYARLKQGFELGGN